MRRVVRKQALSYGGGILKVCWLLFGSWLVTSPVLAVWAGGEEYVGGGCGGALSGPFMVKFVRCRLQVARCASWAVQVAH